MEIRVDPEFRDLCPPLTTAELDALEESILSEGCRVPLDVWSESDTLLDGHNRRAICDSHGVPYQTNEISLADRSSAIQWIVHNQRARRNLTLAQSIDLQLKAEDAIKRIGTTEIVAAQKRRHGTANSLQMEKDTPHNTEAEIAKAAGAGKGSVARFKRVKEAATSGVVPQKVLDDVLSGEESIGGAYKRVVKEEKTQARRQREATPIAPVPPISDRWKLYHCAVSDLRQHVEPDSIDAIICDPPYPREFLDTYADLSEFAAYALKPGGVCLAMAGQSYLPDVVERLGRHLTYHWTLGYFTPGENSPVWPRRVKSAWKPVFWFQKGAYEGEHNDDVVRSRESVTNLHHHWGQSESGMADLILKFSRKGAVICDPFLGGGTTAAVAIRLERQFVGCDVDAACVEKTRERITSEVS